MTQFRTIARIKADNVRSLVWSGDNLIDWAGGGTRYAIDGTIVPRAVHYAYRFDAACSSPSGKYAVIYERLGTKGVLLREGKIVREINRSFYCANAYEYPICFGRLKSGQEVLIHCPEDYNRLEIEDVETGERLTRSEQRNPCDFFHSRLAVDRDGTSLLSAGWVWHPIDTIAVYDLQKAIEDPKSLDTYDVFTPLQSAEISSAAFVNNGRIVLSTSDESLAVEVYDENELRPRSISVWDIAQGKIISQVAMAEPAGTLMALDDAYIVGFYEHPKVIDLRTGEIIARMDDVESGKQTSSIIHHLNHVPPLALDSKSKRFAVASDSVIVIAEVRVDT